MLSSAWSNLVVLPFLLLVSIVLAFTASITSFLALTTLFLRALAVYAELSIALLINFFLFPAHSPASASFLALSTATTPLVERSPARSRHVHHPYYHNTQTRSRRGSWQLKDVAAEDYFFHQTHPHDPASMPPHEVLSSFISGNAERDFEGVGGWRTPLASRKKHNTPPASSESYSSSGEELEDDQAWVSINKRLELPSRYFNFASPAAISPVLTTAASVEHIEEQTRQHHRNYEQQQQQQQKQERPRIHRRSVTTPLFLTSSTASRSSASVSTEQTTRTQQQHQQRQQPQHVNHLQMSKSSVALDYLPRSSTNTNAHIPLQSSSSFTSTSSSWHESPFLMAPATFGADSGNKLAHYPSFTTRRRRSSASSSAAAAARAMSLTGLGLN